MLALQVLEISSDHDREVFRFTVGEGDIRTELGAYFGEDWADISPCQCRPDSTCTTLHHDAAWCYVNSWLTCRDAAARNGQYWSELACTNTSATDTSATSPGRIRRQVHSVPWGFNVSSASITVAAGDTVTWTWTAETIGSVDHDLVSGTRTTGHDGHFRTALQSSESGTFTHTFNCNGTCVLVGAPLDLVYTVHESTVPCVPCTKVPCSMMRSCQCARVCVHRRRGVEVG